MLPCGARFRRDSIRTSESTMILAPTTPDWLVPSVCVNSNEDVDIHRQKLDRNDFTWLLLAKENSLRTACRQAWLRSDPPEDHLPNEWESPRCWVEVKHVHNNQYRVISEEASLAEQQRRQMIQVVLPDRARVSATDVDVPHMGHIAFSEIVVQAAADVEQRVLITA